MENDVKRTKGFFYQVIIELKKLFTSKFMMILMILLLVFSIAVPVVTLIQQNRISRLYGPAAVREMSYSGTIYYGGRYYDDGMEDLVIDGQVIESDNPLYWDIRDMNEQINHLTDRASTPADDLTLKFLRELLDSSLETAKTIKNYDDYRQSLSWRRMQNVIEKFIYENLDKPKDDLLQAVQYRKGIDPDTMEAEYYSLSHEEVVAKLEEIDAKLATIDKIILEDDYLEYYRFEIQNQNDQYNQNLDEIARLEKDITENPQYEEMYDMQIKDMKRHNKIILEVNIPAYEYRLENDIMMSSDDWRNLAVGDRQSTQSNLIYSEIISQEEFEEDEYLKREYTTYHSYTEARQKELDEMTKKLLIADKSLAANKPDMEYVPTGARKKVVGFLWYSMVIAVFGVIIGGGLIAKEYQSGTIRLLLIRPKTRTKIVLSKFLALLLVCLALYTASALLNILANGIVFGFADYGYPNYTISSGPGGVPFFGFYITKFLVCFITILFACATAYFLSATTKITAISVAIPLVCFVGSLIVMQFAAYRPSLNWIVYTPVPYINLANYYINDLTYQSLKPVLGFGIPLMIALSLALIAIGTFVTKKRDVTN